MLGDIHDRRTALSLDQKGIQGRLVMPPLVAIVTGAAQGIGFACAQRFAGEGVSVAVVDRDLQAAQNAVQALPRSELGHLALAGDVTSPDEVRSSVAATVEALGSTAILVNCAGILFPTRFLDISLEEWNEVIAVSMTGTFLFSKACLPGMIESRFGRIINFSSTAGKSVSTLGGAHYTAAKAGVLGLTRALAKEASEYGVTVNAVCPGLIDTEMVRSQCSEDELDRYARSFPAGRLGTPQEIADLVFFLASPEAAYITGASIDINGGDLLV
jgi:3-oxoacyl-[acyl-carrier protein] reductase